MHQRIKLEETRMDKYFLKQAEQAGDVKALVLAPHQAIKQKRITRDLLRLGREVARLTACCHGDAPTRKVHELDHVYWQRSGNSIADADSACPPPSMSYQPIIECRLVEVRNLRLTLRWECALDDAALEVQRSESGAKPGKREKKDKTVKGRGGEKLATGEKEQKVVKSECEPAVSHLTRVLAVYGACLKALAAVQTMCIDGKVGIGPLWKKLSVERVLVHYTALVGIADAKPCKYPLLRPMHACGVVCILKASGSANLNPKSKPTVANKVAKSEVQAESKPGIVPEKNSDKRVREHCLEILAELQKALENADRCGCVGEPLDIVREEAASARWKGTFYEEVGKCRYSLSKVFYGEVGKYRYSLSEVFYGEVTLEEKKAIFQAMPADVGSGVNSFGGHWYTCRNGHAYTIGECGGAIETSRCPECHDVGGRSHQLDASNQAASIFLREVHGPAPQNAWRENAADHIRFVEEF
ncbi:hypothetical protein SARC_01756 [Sphaeroforma arctica JP610]|uniref:RZ-type domain-containing protein n=1 Tax=Sphaeroforma arctica JP610 TaxID=667725 RepID=A0A0L0GAS1_9EUKA|nr:hypothetical protein SARC_01756 [Sphaeroforma arctica JP610]KNC86097.1 hypothetical protein SARC_01756 [Sphaeroforma arctica JP610]|eukprot:XP_014159999.1 hypothetical protein SARC_01756 [Sphaeroforma arctica JP610]